MKKESFVLPIARKENLVVQELSKELLVYDLKNHKAFCLNETASFVLSQCDGQTTLEQASKNLSKDLKAEINADIIWLALDKLEKFNLIKIESETAENKSKISRRNLVKTAMAMGITLPVISALVVPTSVHAQSCIAIEASCTLGGTPCCEGVCFNTESGPTGFTCEIPA